MRPPSPVPTGPIAPDYSPGRWRAAVDAIWIEFILAAMRLGLKSQRAPTVPMEFSSRNQARLPELGDVFRIQSRNLVPAKSDKTGDSVEPGRQHDLLIGAVPPPKLVRRHYWR